MAGIKGPLLKPLSCKSVKYEKQGQKLREMVRMCGTLNFLQELFIKCLLHTRHHARQENV